MQLPRGTQVTIHAEANKPLVQVQLDVVSPDAAPVTHKLDLAASRANRRASFRFELPPLDSDQTLLCTLLDADGIRSRDPVRLSLGAVPDEPPQVNVQLEGISTAITPAARAACRGRDLRRLWHWPRPGSSSMWRRGPAPAAVEATVPAGRDKTDGSRGSGSRPAWIFSRNRNFTSPSQAADTYALARCAERGQQPARTCSTWSLQNNCGPCWRLAS